MGSDNEGKTKNGLPVIDASELPKKQARLLYMIMPAFLLGTCAIGSGIAAVIFYFNCKEKCQAKLTTIGASEMYWAPFSAVLVYLTVLFLNFYPMMYKEGIMTGKSGNLRANMQILKLAEQKSADPDYVVLETDGVIGQYNRANRSLTHFIENSIHFVLLLPLSCFVQPFPTFLITLVFCLGRIMHQTGYSSGYGSHGAGFGLATLSVAILAGMNILIGTKALLKVM
jgi:uncharacterized membrane protein YecN with MAPEG domain